ncbi:hypothetical protein HDU98_002476 [Podochytrium sp. JEL0797]|nr:hypothetical protein HDU98_002476 [Podochytrium sp. JEL0797]
MNIFAWFKQNAEIIISILKNLPSSIWSYASKLSQSCSWWCRNPTSPSHANAQTPPPPNPTDHIIDIITISIDASASSKVDEHCKGKENTSARRCPSTKDVTVTLAATQHSPNTNHAADATVGSPALSPVESAATTEPIADTTNAAVPATSPLRTESTTTNTTQSCAATVPEAAPSNSTVPPTSALATEAAPASVIMQPVTPAATTEPVVYTTTTKMSVMSPIATQDSGIHLLPPTPTTVTALLKPGQLTRVSEPRKSWGDDLDELNRELDDDEEMDFDHMLALLAALPDQFPPCKS